MQTAPIRATIVFLALIVPGPAFARVPAPLPDEPPSLSDLGRAWTRSVSPLPPRTAQNQASMSRTDALAALAGGHRMSRCATPLLVALHQQGGRLNAPTRLLLERAVMAAPQALSASVPSAGREFLIHYTTDPLSADRVHPADLDLSGVPDGVERLAAELTDVLAGMVHDVAWPPAPAGAGGAERQSPPVDVFMVGLGEGAGTGRLHGFARPLPSAEARVSRGGLEDAPEGAATALYLDASLAAPEASPRAALAHQIAHLVQMRESVRESVWWQEASASWLENHLEGTVNDTLASLRSRGLRRGRGPDQPTLAPGLESFLWPHYLVQSTGSDASLVRRLWEEMGAVPGNNTLEAMDRVLRRTLQSSLAEEIRLFNIWNLFLGAADDGRHYPFAAQLPTPSEDAAYEAFPVRGGSLGGPIFPLGSALVRLLGDGSDGGLKIRFDGAETGRWDLALLVHPAGRPGDVRHVPVEVDAQGHAAISVPWSELAAIDLLIQNLSAAGSPADYAFAIDHDLRVPFDLLEFTASATGQGVSLAWSTEEEQRLAGWNVYRGSGPLGPFSRLNPWLVPGGGLEDRPMGYVYVDDTTQPGRKYYYRLEGVTFEGFTRSSHPAGVRTPPRELQPR